MGRIPPQQPCAAGDHQPCLLAGRDDLDLDAGRLAHPYQELGAIGGAAAGLGSDVAAGADAALPQLVGADLEGIDGARHCRLRQPAARRQPFAEPDDAREGLDDLEAGLRFLRHQQPAIIGAEIERGIGRGIPAVGGARIG